MSFEGLQDFGDGKQQNIDDQADHALVFLFQPLMASFTQPIALFTSKETTPGLKLAQLVIQAIIFVEKAGAIVHGVISDGASTNRKFWKEMGVSGKLSELKWSFNHPTDENRKIFMFSDTPHLMKNVRNRMYGKTEMENLR